MSTRNETELFATVCASWSGSFSVSASPDAPRTGLALTSEELPGNLHDLRITVAASHEGFGSNGSLEIENWIQASIIRRSETSSVSRPFGSSLLTEDVTAPERLSDEVEKQGWNFVKLNENSNQISHKLFALPASILLQTLSTICSVSPCTDAMSTLDFLKHVRSGDCILLWATAERHGWSVTVKHARMEYRTKVSFNMLPPSSKLTFAQDTIDAKYEDLVLFKKDGEERFTPLSTIETPVYWDSDGNPYKPPVLKFAVKGEDSLGPPEQRNTLPKSDPTGLSQIVLSELQKLHKGHWILCDHDCTVTEHGHNFDSCSSVKSRSSHTVQDGSVVRSVNNPCSHYWKPTDMSDLVRYMQVCQTSPENLLEIMVLQKERTPIMEGYAALSYCWGDLSVTKPVMLNHIYRKPDDEKGVPGICVRHPFNITEGLFSFLRYLRDANRPWPFWIDAICIDQSDPVEKGIQVAKMGDMYEKASMVGIWLNENAALSREIYKRTFGLSKLVEDKFADGDNPYVHKEEVGPAVEDQFRQRGGVESTQHLLDTYFNLPWFSRVWVLQEVFRSDANAYIFPTDGPCLSFSDVLVALSSNRKWHTSRSLTPVFPNTPYLWQILCRGAAPKQNQTQPSASTENIQLRSVKLWNQFRGEMKNVTFLPLTLLFHQGIIFNSTDPRDKLYALLGLCIEWMETQTKPLAIAPDYTKTDSDVFRRLTDFVLRKSARLDFLWTTSLSPNSRVLDSSAAVLGPSYTFPPQDHPTWALWHCSVAGWTQNFGHAPLYHGFPFTSSADGSLQSEAASRRLSVDLELLQDAGSQELPLRGIELDEVYAVVPTCFRDMSSGKAFVNDATDLSKASLQEIWDTVLTSYYECRKDQMLAVWRMSRTQQQEGNGERSSSLVSTAERSLEISMEVATEETPPSTFLELAKKDSRLAQELSVVPFSIFLGAILCDSALPSIVSARPGEQNSDAAQIAEQRDFQNFLEKSPVMRILSARLDHLAFYWASNHPERTNDESVPLSKFLDLSSERYPGHSLMPPFPQWVQSALVALVAEGRRELIDQLIKAGASRLHHMVGRWCCVTRAGQVALVPYGTKAGDKLVALWGAKRPVLLRPAPKNNMASSSNVQAAQLGNEPDKEELLERWLFVGETTVRDWMDGSFVEQLLGSGVRERIWTLI